ncbi:MAG: TorD/DmsD family molecular chaperone [Desulfitobacteriaceae bacterium]
MVTLDYETLEELYLSFAGIFQRPRAQIADHLEEIIELWSETIPAPPQVLTSLNEFCASFPAGEPRLNALWGEYIPLFETGAVEAPPYASVYLDKEGLVMGEEAFAVQAAYSAAGYGVSQEGKEIPDHLGVELEFLALLASDQADEVMEDFRQRHLLPFLRVILPKIRQAQRPVFSAAAELLENWQIKSFEIL